MKKKDNSYDWLGNGYYFWENNYDRALSFANEVKANPEKFNTKIKKPAVLGAVISLGNCFDLLDNHNISMLQEYYKIFEESYKKLDIQLPINKKTPDNSNDNLLRYLDCAVLESFHSFLKDIKHPPFDSVRGVFGEGQEIYPNAGFKEKNHIQICIKNPECIKGFFIPLNSDQG